MTYADENFQSARVLLESRLFNPCLHNVQQAVEKWLKAVLIEMAVPLKKTHSIFELRDLCVRCGMALEVSDDECEFLDSIYLPSKYPLGSALPDFEPNDEICQKALSLAEKIRSQVEENFS